jgi:hypothetical protein
MQAQSHGRLVAHSLGCLCAAVLVFAAPARADAARTDRVYYEQSNVPGALSANPDGTDIRPFYPAAPAGGPDPDATGLQYGGPSRVAPAPDGEHVAYVAFFAAPSLPGQFVSLVAALAVSRPDGADPRVIANDIHPDLGSSELSWSPDGTEIAFAQYTGPRTYDPSGWSIAVASVADGSVRSVQPAEPPSSPFFSNDGTRIAYLTNRDAGPSNLRIYDLATGLDSMVPGSNANALYGWSPDGQHLLSQAGGNLELVDINDGASQLLAQGNRGYMCCADYSPDGSKLVYATVPGSSSYYAMVVADLDGANSAVYPSVSPLTGLRWGSVVGASVEPVNNASGSVSAGESVATNTVATPQDPTGTAVTSPVEGQISVSEGPVVEPAPSGYVFAAQQVNIEAPAATADAPLRLVFRLDASELPSGSDAQTLVAFRNGVPIAACDGPEGHALPDPCVADRQTLDDGDAQITVLTSHASRWNFAADTAPPVVSCGVSDGQWHATNVTLSCTAVDTGSGLAKPSDGSFTLSTSVSAGVESSGAATNSLSICDQLDNCTVAGPIGGNRVDRKRPVSTVVAPAQGANYPLLRPVLASYACADGGSGIASCTGTTNDGARLDTGLFALGKHTFTVTAKDKVGNTTTEVRTYQVSLLGLGILVL